MDEFDLDRLTDHDFEHLCKDLFEEQLGLPLEIFSTGADGGVDLRYEHDDVRVVVQCKHYRRSGRAGLLRRYKESEASTVKALAPTRYVVATTAELNPRAKRQLQTMVDPVPLASGDIYGVAELAALLRARPHVVGRHLRLWLGSSSALIRVIHRDVARRSMRLAKDIEHALQLYVPDVSFDVARRMLEEHHCCVISGVPGVGKTTLARVVCAAYLREGYALVDASMELQDLDRVWDEGKQVFFVDDFLGQATLDDRRADAASRALLQLFRDARNDPDKRMILTTRDYVLAQAREYSDSLRHEDFTPVRCVVEVENYSRRNKAKMLYNHLYFSSLTAEQRAEFAAPGIISRIVEHSGFSPRTLEHVLLKPFGRTAGTAVEELIQNLDDPARIWEHLIEEVFTPDEVGAAVVIYTLDGGGLLEDFREGWTAYLSLPDTPDSGRRFLRVLKRLNGTILTSSSSGRRRTRLSVQDPSVLDYLAAYAARRPEIVRTILRTATSMHQIEYLWRGSRSTHGRRRRHTATAQVDALLRATLREAADEVAAAIDRLSGPGRSTSGDAAARRPVDDAYLAVAVADEFAAPSTVDVATRLLDAARTWGPRASADKLVDLVLRLQAARVPELRQRHGLVVIETLKLVPSEIDDWDYRAADLELLGRLAELAPPDLVEELSVKQDDAAEMLLADWADVAGEPDFAVDESELTQILEWVDDRGDHLVTGYEEARAYLDRLAAEYARTDWSTTRSRGVPAGHTGPDRIDDIVESIRRELATRADSK